MPKARWPIDSDAAATVADSVAIRRWLAYSRIDGPLWPLNGRKGGGGGGSGGSGDCEGVAGFRTTFIIFGRPAARAPAAAATALERNAPVQSPTLSSRYLQLFDKGFLAAIAAINYPAHAPANPVHAHRIAVCHGVYLAHN